MLSTARRIPVSGLPVAAALRRWMLSRGPAVTGVGLGLRVRGGRALAEPVAVVLVDRKRPLSALHRGEAIPPALFGWPTDVRESGPFYGCSQLRPAPGGASVGHFKGESGTLACRARDLRGAGGLLLSNNHVLTNFNRGAVGDPILQPARALLGYPPRDNLARLLRWVPLDLDPGVPAAEHDNPVDAAVAEELSPGLVSPELLGLGRVTRWRASEDVPIGLEVAKSGAVSGVTRGQVTVRHASARLKFHGVGAAVMRDQILTTHLTQAGDSGALVVCRDGPAGWAAVGLACGASRSFSMVNPIEVVQSLLEIEVAAQRWRAH